MDLNRMRVLRTALAALCVLAVAPADQIRTVFVIPMENHNWTQPGTQTSPAQILGNPAAPYINSLVTPGNANAVQVSFAANYQNTGSGIHPSEPNYLWSEGGTNYGILNDDDPFPSNDQSATNHLCGYLQSLGIGWKSYQEDTDLSTSSGQLTNTPLSPSQYTVPLVSFAGSSSLYTNPYNGRNQYGYAAKHNPQVFFLDTDGGDNQTTSNPEASHYAPLQVLQSDLAGGTVAPFNWISPDLYNDMHTALSGGFTYHGTNWSGDQAAVAAGDNFLSIVVPMIMASSAYQNGGVIVIWNDETEGGDDPSRTIMEIVISPLAKGNAYRGTVRYTHSSDLRSWQEVFGVGPITGIGDAQNASDLSDLFQLGALGPQRIAGTVTLQNYSSAAVEGTPVTVEIRSPGSTTDLDRQTVTLASDGSFTLETSVGPGTYDIAVKGSHWLRKRLQNLTVTSLGAGGLSFSLINGDINGDNTISLGDFGQLKLAYGSVPGNANWNPNADLDGNGSVGLSDFGVLKLHYGLSGDP